MLNNSEGLYYAETPCGWPTCGCTSATGCPDMQPLLNAAPQVDPTEASVRGPKGHSRNQPAVAAPITTVEERLRDAAYDDRLATGALYLEAAELICELLSALYLARGWMVYRAHVDDLAIVDAAIKNAAPQASPSVAPAGKPLGTAGPAVAAPEPMFDAVQLSEANYYRHSKEPIGILARAILRAIGETPT